MRKLVFAGGLLLLYGWCAPQSQAAQLDRITGRINPSRLIAIKGNIHPKARAEDDRGPVAPSMALDYITLRLKPTAAQQADLDQLLAQQQDPASPNFRRWLTPEQYADRFGASKSDIAQIAGWLEGQGLTVAATARGRNFVVFKGTAGMVEAALKVEIHNFLVDGEMHYANATEPSVPAAVQSFAIGYLGLDDFRMRPSPQAVQPRLNYDGEHVLAPGDLWVIYNTTPFLFNLGVSGTGMKMAVVGQSNVNLSDMAAYQNDFGLPSNPPVKLLIPGGTDPGVVSGDSGESDLDLELADAMAPYAEILFVYASDIVNATTYAIDQAVAPVVSDSYAGCEPGQSSTYTAAVEPLAQQGNAEGVTWIAASGDAGAAACDGGNSVAKNGIAVMLPASVPEVTGVGGTTFNEGISSYWASANGEYGYSALSYIPEVGWNDTSAVGHLSASGGGMSTLYKRPAWQTGPGVQALNVRFVPDVSMSASEQHDPYLVVEGGTVEAIGGTSAATPVFAGIMLLLNQYLGTNGLGNINPELYSLASTTSGVFHDITSGSNLVPCVAGTNGCISGYLGYAASTGYDMVTGLGSVNAYNLALAWKGAAQPSVTQIFNAASYVDSGLSPGLIFSVKGSGLGPSAGQTLEVNGSGEISNIVSGVQILVNGTPAPILYTSATQINAVAPYEIANLTGQRVNVEVINNGVSSATISDPVVSTAPAIFNLGNNAAAVINQDGSVNSAVNPAARGSYVSIYATGEGQTNPAGIDGFLPDSAASLSRPNASVSVFMNQFSAQVLYAGTASFDGFFQVNAVVPQGLSPGTVPITLTVGGVASPTLNMFVK